MTLNEHKVDEQYWLENFREALIDMVCNDTGVEYTDAGVWVTDEQVDKLLAHYAPKPIVTPDTSDGELLNTLGGILHPERQESYDNLLNGIACHYERLGKGITTAHAAEKYTLEYVHGQLQALIHQQRAEAWKEGYAEGWNRYNEAPYNTKDKKGEQ